MCSEKSSFIVLHTVCSVGSEGKILRDRPSKQHGSGKLLGTLYELSSYLFGFLGLEYRASNLHVRFFLLTCLRLLFQLWIIILVSQMPSYAGAGANCSKLMNDISRNKVDVIIS